MEQKDNSATQQGQCPGDCRLCHTVQRAYCATQISFNTQKAVEALLASVTMLTEKMDTLIRKQESDSKNAELLFTPQASKESTPTPPQPTTEMKLEVFT